MRTGNWYWFISYWRNEQEIRAFVPSKRYRGSRETFAHEDIELAIWIWEELYNPSPKEQAYKIRDQINEMTKKMYELM